MQKYKAIRQCDECETEEPKVMVNNFKMQVWQSQLENFREIVINEDITDALVEKVVLQIFNINRYDDTAQQQLVDYEREPITILINSSGGDIDAALSICASIETSETPVHTVALGKALSAGFLILIAGHMRFAQHYSRLMYHTGTSGYIGVITDLLEHGDYLESLNDSIHTMVMAHTDITEQQLDDVFMRKADWYLSIGEALRLKVIDAIYAGPGRMVNQDDEIDDDDEPVGTDDVCDTANHCGQCHCGND